MPGARSRTRARGKARTWATKARAKDHGQIKRSKVRSQWSGGLEHGAAEGVGS